MFTDLYLYLSDFFGSWAGCIWSLLLIVDVLGMVLYRQQSDALNEWLSGYISESRRVIALRVLLVALLFWAGFSVWREQHHVLVTNAQRKAVQDQLAHFMNESADMQRVCQDRNSAVPDVPRWKIKVEQYLVTLGPSYKARFEAGESSIHLGLDPAHEACWEDLHQRDENIKEFFADFRAVSTTE
jgi:hypothetical protein